MRSVDTHYRIGTFHPQILECIFRKKKKMQTNKSHKCFNRISARISHRISNAMHVFTIVNRKWYVYSFWKVSDKRRTRGAHTNTHTHIPRRDSNVQRANCRKTHFARTLKSSHHRFYSDMYMYVTLNCLGRAPGRRLAI